MLLWMMLPVLAMTTTLWLTEAALREPRRL
jgi:hypothetical protein